LIVIKLTELVILVDTPALFAYISIAAKVIIVVGVLQVGGDLDQLSIFLLLILIVQILFNIVFTTILFIFSFLVIVVEAFFTTLVVII
jgi:hypothetical protein